jgi:hypothetical protein
MIDDIQRRQRRKLLLLAALFFLPITASFVLYYGTDWRPTATSNHGVLIHPARPLPEAAEPLRGKWALVYVGEGSCAQACRDALVFARQTRLALNQEMTRVDRVLLATGNCCDLEYLDAEHAGIKVFDVSEEPARGSLLAVLPPEDREYSLYIVDPLGNLVMRYDTREEPRGLLSDLRKLLKLSHIG